MRERDRELWSKRGQGCGRYAGPHAGRHADAGRTGQGACARGAPNTAFGKAEAAGPLARWLHSDHGVRSSRRCGLWLRPPCLGVGLSACSCPKGPLLKRFSRGSSASHAGSVAGSCPLPLRETAGHRARRSVDRRGSHNGAALRDRSDDRSGVGRPHLVPRAGLHPLAVEEEPPLSACALLDDTQPDVRTQAPESALRQEAAQDAIDAVAGEEQAWRARQAEHPADLPLRVRAARGIGVRRG